MIVTLFPNYAAREKREANLTLDDLHKMVLEATAPTKEDLPWVKFTRFGNIPNPQTNSGCLRWDGNVKEVCGVLADYDDEEMTPEEAAERLDKAGVNAIVYTSPSHTNQKPRWRVGCPFSARLEPDKHYHMVARLNLTAS
jgi:hypothetical protein